jgi:hypothetical protein
MSRYRSKENPAQWRGNLDQVLVKPSKVRHTRNHPATQIDDAHAFIKQLRSNHSTAARCLEFVVLTACRSGEARLATWAEIDLPTAVWNNCDTGKRCNATRLPLGLGGESRTSASQFMQQCATWTPVTLMLMRPTCLCKSLLLAKSFSRKSNHEQPVQQPPKTKTNPKTSAWAWFWHW